MKISITDNVFKKIIDKPLEQIQGCFGFDSIKQIDKNLDDCLDIYSKMDKLKIRSNRLYDYEKEDLIQVLESYFDLTDELSNILNSQKSNIELLDTCIYDSVSTWFDLFDSICDDGRGDLDVLDMFTIEEDVRAKYMKFLNEIILNVDKDYTKFKFVAIEKNGDIYAMDKNVMKFDENGDVICSIKFTDKIFKLDKKILKFSEQYENIIIDLEKMTFESSKTRKIHQFTLLKLPNIKI